MSLIRGLVLLHLSATALLSALLVLVMAQQRVADALRSRRGARPARAAAVSAGSPASAAHVPTQAAPAAPAVPAQAPAPSVRDVTIDLRDPALGESASVLQRTS